MVLDARAVRVLVEEAYRSNAGIVGPKLVTADDPKVLLEVGRAIDRFGAPYTGIEPGELDQEQHDGVRDVFYVTTATMLVRTDLFAELGGFDPATFPGSEDLDLCWRARLAGARVLVAPDARVAHREAAEERARADRPDDAALARTRVRVLLTSYSFLTLLWLVPVGVVVGFIEALGDVVTGRPRRARAAIGAWISNLVHLRSLRPARKQAQSLRQVHDRDLRELQVGSLTRLSVFFAHHVHTDERLRAVRYTRPLGGRLRLRRAPRTGDARVPRLPRARGGRVARPDHAAACRRSAPWCTWPAVGDLFDAFGSAWRYTGLGSSSAAPPLLALMGGFGTVLFGAVGLGAHPRRRRWRCRSARSVPTGSPDRVMGLRGPALAAGIAYGVNPVARNAIAEGRLGPLVLFALLPFLLSQVLAIVRLDAGSVPNGEPVRADREPRASGDGVPRASRRARAHPALRAPSRVRDRVVPAGRGVSSLLAVLAVLVVSPLTGEVGRSLRAVGIALVGALGRCRAAVPVAARVHRRAGRRARRSASRSDPTSTSPRSCASTPGPPAAGWAMWGLLVAAAVPLFLATGSRLAWATRGWVLALVGVGRRVGARHASPPTSRCLRPKPGSPSPRSGSRSRSASACRCSSTASARSGSGGANRRRSSAASRSCSRCSASSPTRSTAGGTAPESDWSESLAFTSSLAQRASSGCCGSANPTVLPLDPVVLDDGTGYTLTRNGPGDATELLRAPEHDADHVIDHAIELAQSGLTNRLGRLLAPVGVRYVAVPSTQGRDGGRAPPRVALAARNRSTASSTSRDGRPSAGLVLYENLAWIPLRAIVSGDAADDVPVGAVDPTRAALGADLAGAAAPATGELAPGIVLWGEAYDDAWDATGDGAACVTAHLRVVERLRARRARARCRSSSATSGSAGRCSARRW